MIDQLINNISNAGIQDFFRQKIPSFRPEEEELWIDKDQGYEEFSDFIKLGSAKFSDEDELLVFSCQYRGELTQRSSKKKQFEIAKSALKEEFKDGAIFIFYDEEGRFRFSFIRRNYGDQDEKYTPWRRYTYFVQPGLPNKTFRNRIGNCEFTTLDEIQNAFSVEPLSKEFYKRLSHWYFYALDHVEFPNDRNEDEYTVKANGLIRLITRIMFVWFMKQIRLVPNELFDRDHVDKLLNDQDATGSTYYKAILQNLFFATLNTYMGERRFVGSGQRNDQYGMPRFLRYERMFKDKETFLSLIQNIPFINGGLFECLDQVGENQHEEIRVDCFSTRPANEERLKVPDQLFFGTSHADLSDYLGNNAANVEIKGLVDLLEQYDFTIDENTPYDQEVALDPELLGLVFENLLASYNPETESTARKESGSFYTPREVVDFMVEESLLEYLKQETKLEESNLKALLKNNDDQPFEKQDDKKTIIEALSNLKLLDPACGSGAYPMGALQKMVNVLSLLDKDNQMWYERQKAIALEETDKAYEIGDREERRQRIDDIEKAFEEGVKDPDYARKLYLIENTLYGVDIQPIAIQITKLRFFISLLVDQRINKDEQEDNLGILALPNLETRFVAANFIKHLPGSRDPQFSIGNDHIEPMVKELEQVRHDLFNAKTAPTKKKRRDRHEELQIQIGETLKNLGFPNYTAEYIETWKPFDPNTYENWFDPEWMFGVRHFDIVVGNPPYIQLQSATSKNSSLKLGDFYKDEGYQTFERSGDIYALFFERGLEVLKKHGLVCLITSNKWLRSNYGKSLRRFFAQRKPLKLIDLGPGVFQSATVDTCVLLAQNTREQQPQLQGLTLSSRSQISAIKPEDMMSMSNLSEESWIILKPEEQSIKEKIEVLGTRLNKWNIEVKYGIRTGYNPAYIIDGNKKDQFISKDSKCSEVIEPILRGRDIQRYIANFNDLWIILVRKNFHEKFKNEYPLLYEFVSSFKESLKNRGQVRSGSHHWIEIDNSPTKEYLIEFKREKIIYREMVRQGEFFYDEYGEYYCNDTGRIITGQYLKFLVGLFNSKFFFFAIKRFYGGGGLGSEGVRMKHTFFDKCPVPIPTENLKKKVEDYVDQIQVKKAKNQGTTFFEEQQIDLMVYKLYELTYDEVLVIDPNPPFRREDFEQAQIEAI